MISADPCPHLWLPECICDLPDDIDDPGAHLPACPHFDSAVDPADHGPSALDCPSEYGPRGDEYDWLTGPDDPSLWPDGSE